MNVLHLKSSLRKPISFGQVAVKRPQHLEFRLNTLFPVLAKLAMKLFEESGLIDRPRRGAGWACLGLGDLPKTKQFFTANIASMLKTNAKPRGIESMVGMAYLIAADGEPQWALEILSLVKHHSSANYEAREKVHKLWEELEAELDADTVSAAEARGRELDLFDTAETPLADTRL